MANTYVENTTGYSVTGKALLDTAATLSPAQTPIGVTLLVTDISATLVDVGGLLPRVRFRVEDMGGAILYEGAVADDHRTTATFRHPKRANGLRFVAVDLENAGDIASIVVSYIRQANLS